MFRFVTRLFSSSQVDETTYKSLQGGGWRQPRKMRQSKTPETKGRPANDSVHEPKMKNERDITSERGPTPVGSTDGVHERDQGAKSPSSPVKLIIAFDIGATYSGISYCIHEPDRVPEILGVTKFPAQESVANDAKVPSLLYYDRSGSVRAAGAEVLADSVIEAALTEGWTKAEWWKLHLRPNHIASSVHRRDDLPSLPPGKSAVDVLSDFIKYLSQCAKTYILERHPTFSWPSSERCVEYIFTHPNGWEGVQQLYRQAIECAGLVPSTHEGHSRVHMLSEGEASLHFCVSNLLSVGPTNQPATQGVLIIDAGGGTVDLSMFSMTFSPITCEEIAPAECRLEGSVFVTCRARSLLEKKLEGWEYSTKDDISEFTREFDQSTKLTIKNDQEPAYVKVAERRYNNSEYNILYGKLKLPGKEATSLFDDSVDAIINSFEQQRKSSMIPITMAFLVGGFSTNGWLWSRIQSYFKERNIEIWRPDNHINKAVANGAVLCHVDPVNHLVSSKVGHRLYDMIEDAIKNGKRLSKSDVKAALEAVKTLRVQGQSLDNKISSLHGKLAESTSVNQALHATLRAHEQKHHCEVLYSQGRVSDAASLVETIDVSDKAVKDSELIMTWFTEFTNRCVAKLEIAGDGALKAGRHDEAVKAYSAALSLSHSVPKTPLANWASTMVLTRRSADEILTAAAKFKHPKLDIYCAICDALEQNGRVAEAIAFFREMSHKLAKDLSTFGGSGQWGSIFLRRCRERLEKLANGAMETKSYGEAAEYLSTILSLGPADRVEILIKRSKARLLAKSWNEASSDADEAINLDPTSLRGYEAKHAALHGAKRFPEAVETFDTLLSKIRGSLDGDIRKLEGGYTDARITIQQIVKDIIRPLPQVLIDTATGRLCDKQQQAKAFEALPIYSELISSMTRKVDEGRIHRVVKEFYRYVMLSHNWEDGEPRLQQVQDIAIDDLEPSMANTKLRKFYLLVRRLGYRWAWSDTCCIDKQNNVVLQESLVAMFTWYRSSALTIVYLRGVSSDPLLPGGLRRSVWNTRGWTYQEYVAAEIVQFYAEDWEPYLGLSMWNHKESPAVISEMQQATGISAKEMVVLKPGPDRVREKLFLASERKTTLVEDAAYSLFGIFNVALPVIYGERDRAIGRLLEHILTASGDVTVLAWTGASGDYNSCLPRKLTVYNALAPPHIPVPLEKAQMDTVLAGLRLRFPGPEDVTSLYMQLKALPSPSFASSRLKLPAITSAITKLEQTFEAGVYRATTLLFGQVEIKTAEDLMGKTDLCLCHPWIRPLLDQERARSNTAMSALRLLARLRQQFGALVLAPVSHIEYIRVAADGLVMGQMSDEVSLTELKDGIRIIEIK